MQSLLSKTSKGFYMTEKGMQKEMKTIPIPCYWIAKVIISGITKYFCRRRQTKKAMSLYS